jgi:hypothetical protein
MSALTRRAAAGVLATVLAVSFARVAQAEAPIKAGANAEEQSLVRTEVVTEEASGTRQAKRGGTRQVWVWDHRKLCFMESGEYIYLREPPSRGPGHQRINPHEQVLALYELVQASPSGGRIVLQRECRPLPSPTTTNPTRPFSQDRLTLRVEEWLRVPSPTLGLSPQGTAERPGLTGSATRFWAEASGLWAPPPTTLGGIQVEVQAWPVGYRWDSGDGTGSASVLPCTGNEQEPIVPGACGGTAAQPQVVHVYETKSSVGAADGVLVPTDVVYEGSLKPAL